MNLAGHVTHAVSTGPSLSDGIGGFRLILHVLAATVWVGGQFTIAGLLPTIRSLGQDARPRRWPRPSPACCGRPMPCW